MNDQIRALLIEQSRKRIPITYGEIMIKLGLDHGEPEHRKILSDELYHISKFEHEQQRPLLSSMAMYSKFENHGPGFYELAEEFGFGKKGKLVEEFFAFEEMNRCQGFWLEEHNYKQYGNLPEVANYNFPFFNAVETDFLHSWGGVVYDKENVEHRAAKNYIIDAPGSKTVFWLCISVKVTPLFRAKLAANLITG
jgi:hypothetical protein